VEKKLAQRPIFRLSKLFRDTIENSKAKRSFTCLVFAHRQADPDALCAAHALSETIKKIASKTPGMTVSSKVVAPESASVLGASVCEKLGIQYFSSSDKEEIVNSDLIVVVDAGEIELIEPYSQDVLSSHSRKMLIDHHSSNKEPNESKWKEFERIVDDNATSTCEIITMNLSKNYFDPKTAKALLAGLMFDSQHLGLATESTLEAALKLIRSGARIDETKELLRSKPDRSELIARLKAAQRMKYIEAGKYILASTEVSSYQAAVARMLVEVGGDVGMAFGGHEGETRISLRSTQHFFRNSKVDLGQLLSSIASESGLIGGGHSTAASISGKVEATELANTIMSRLKERLL
jgi:nanoRNase/pAp phosphatase (c-di-AMP/oligoRNAs hydrolase)